MVIFGASGDLAKKKTFPTIWSLYLHDYLPENVEIIGYARTKMTADELVETHLRKYIKAKTRM
jgi:glucose-6-phosphate 1-dehydrogenase